MADITTVSFSYSNKAFFQKRYQEQGQQFSFAAKDREETDAWRESFRRALSEKLGLGRLTLWGTPLQRL